MPAQDSNWALAVVSPPPPPPPAPRVPLSCPAGQRVDAVEDAGDNGSCDCAECASTAPLSLPLSLPLLCGTNTCPARVFFSLNT